ncbi:putative neuraminidase [Dyadobacter jejuensis]|uniref:Putative neuraminidase n=1 Tax=Dyadobacter jejuensis TaxID=1082580 RepID=A0A316AJR8_9BACT|nr:sialidase family protein [Dyadobacter jejuensis]PWJ57772.1 putative neuraminidase [Dyadobacter jejuensis]
MTPIKTLSLFILAAFTVLARPASAQVVVSETLIFSPQQEHAHASSLVALPNGDLLVAWFQGSGERKSDDVRILGARLKKGSKTWSSPFLMADTPHIPDCNPVLFLNGSGKLFLVWIAVQANLWEQSILRYKTATDYDQEGAPHWSWQDNILLKPDSGFATELEKRLKELPEHGIGWAAYAPKYDEMILEAGKDPAKRSTGWMTRIKPIQLASGRIILPLYSDGFNLSLMAISDDDGDTWTPSLPVVGRGPIQPAIAKSKNGDLVAYMRDSGDYPPKVHRSVSTDDGLTWSATQKTNIPNTASVELLTLQDGKWAFLGNDIYDGRYRLSLYLSDDEGASWKGRLLIEEHPADEGGYSYPALIQTADGMLHMTYSFHPESHKKSIKYVTVDPTKIKLTKKTY